MHLRSNQNYIWWVLKIYSCLRVLQKNYLNWLFVFILLFCYFRFKQYLSRRLRTLCTLFHSESITERRCHPATALINFFLAFRLLLWEVWSFGFLYRTQLKFCNLRKSFWFLVCGRRVIKTLLTFDNNINFIKIIFIFFETEIFVSHWCCFGKDLR